MRDSDIDTTTLVLEGVAVSSIDDIVWTFDVVANVPSGAVITGVSAALYKETSEIEFPDGLPTDVDFDGTVIAQEVSGLIKGVDYRLQIGYTMDNGTTLSFAQPMMCVF